MSLHEHRTAIVTDGGEWLSARPFSTDHCAPVSRQREDELEETVVVDEWLTGELLNKLLATRFLVLAGEPEVGKKTLALHLSHRVRKVVKTCRETFMAVSLRRNVRLELQQVAEEKAEFGGRVIIFPQVGEGDNGALLESFLRLKGVEQLDKLQVALENSKSFFLFTADSQHVKPFRENLQRLDVLHEVPAPPPHLLATGLEKRLKKFIACRDVPAAKAEAARALVAERRELLLARLPRMAQLTFFVERYLLAVLDEEQRLDLSSALDLVESHEKWFLEDLGRDFEAWCFVYTLALCQCGSESTGVPWLEFDAIRGEITRHLARELRTWRHAQDEPPFARILDERALLEKCRARIARESGVGDFVRFEDDRYPDKLWDVFMNSGRRLMTLTLPVLQRLAQSADTPIRARAARILGRLGEASPAHITLETIERWTAAKPLRQKAAVGYLLEGALTSPDEDYRQLCRARLEALSRSGNPGKLWTAVAAHKQLGRGGGEELAKSIATLGEITERNFSEWIGLKKKLEQLEHQLEALIQKKKKDPQEVMAAAVGTQALRELRGAFRRAYDEDDQIMFAICYSLVALALHVGTFEVMAELNKWYSQGHKSLDVLTSWIFWMEEGVADSLAEYMVRVPAAETVSGAPRDCHAFVVSVGDAARTDPQAVAQVARFLASTYGQFPDFHTRTRQFLRRKFLSHLKGWADSAWPAEKYRDVMVQLYAQLLRSQQAGLSAHLADYLRNDSEFNGRAHLKRFAEQVFRAAAAGAAAPTRALPEGFKRH